MTDKTIILEEVLKLKGQTFTYTSPNGNKRDILIDFEIVENTQKTIKLQIDKKVKDFWRIYWYLKFDGGLQPLKDIIKEKEWIVGISGDAYVNADGKEYGNHGCCFEIRL